MHVSTGSSMGLQGRDPSACPKCAEVTFLTLVHASLILLNRSGTDAYLMHPDPGVLGVQCDAAGNIRAFDIGKRREHHAIHHD
jgi:hypothetical protein